MPGAGPHRHPWLKLLACEIGEGTIGEGTIPLHPALRVFELAYGNIYPTVLS